VVFTEYSPEVTRPISNVTLWSQCKIAFYTQTANERQAGWAPIPKRHVITTMTVIL
jgi:hypothetical protein